MARVQSIVKFTYQWGMAMAVVAVVYRLFSIVSPLGETIATATTIQPRNCLQLSVLLLLMCIASQAYGSVVAKTQ